MARFIIVRHGNNAANQSMRLRMVLGTVEAPTREAAHGIAAREWTCYNNQHFEAIDLAGITRREDREEAATMDALRDAGAINR
jgi:hypothetical protein